MEGYTRAGKRVDFNRNTLTDALVFRDWGVLLEEDED